MISKFSSVNKSIDHFRLIYDPSHNLTQFHYYSYAYRLHKNGAFRNSSSNQRNLKKPALRFQSERKLFWFETGAFRKRWHKKLSRISLLEFSSNTNPKRPTIVAFKNFSGLDFSQPLVYPSPTISPSSKFIDVTEWPRKIQIEFGSDYTGTYTLHFKWIYERSFYTFACILHHLQVKLLTMWPAPSWLDSSLDGAQYRYHRGHGFGSRSSLT